MLNLKKAIDENDKTREMDMASERVDKSRYESQTSYIDSTDTKMFVLENNFN